MGIMPKRTKRVSVVLGSASVVKAGPSMRGTWRDGEENPEPMGLMGDDDEVFDEGPSGVDPRLRNFMALPFAGVRKALEAVLLVVWKAEKV